MSFPSFPIGFPESAEQSLCPELSSELTMALAAGEWWAIMEVSSPISEEPEYGDLTSGLWWGTMEAGETPCSTSKSTKQWRRNKTQGAPVPTRSQQESPVLRSSKKLNLTSSQEKSQDWRKLNIPEPLRKERLQKKPQEAPVPAQSPQKAPVPTGSPQRAPVPKSLQRPPVPVPKVLACSSHRAPMPEKSQDWRKLNIPEPLRQEQLQKNPQEAPVPAQSPQKAPVPTGSPQRPPVPAPKMLACFSHRAPMPEKSQDWRKLNIPEPLRQERLQKKPQEAPVPAQSPQKAPVPKSLQRPPVPAPKVLACSSHRAPMPEKSQDWRKLNIPEPLRQEQLQKSQAPSFQGTLADNILKRPKLKIPEPLRGELLQQRPQASSPQGATIPDKTSKREKLEVPEPLRRELLQLKPQASLQGRLPDNISKRQKLKIPEPLRRELLQQRPQASSLQGAPLPDKTAKREKQKILESLKQEMLQQKPVCCAQGSPVPDKVPEKRNLISELLRKELLQQKPQANKPLPDRTPVGASEHARTPQGAAVPAMNPQAVAVPSGALKGADMPPRIPKYALVHSGTSQGSLVPADSPKLGESLRIPKQQRQKQRKQQGQQRQQTIPKGASVSPKTSQSALVPPCSTQGASGFQQEALMASRAPQYAPVPLNLSTFLQGTTKRAAVPGRTINQGQSMIPRHQWQQKPSPFAQSHSGPPMSSQSKRLCRWSTEASDNVGVCQPPPQNKICVEIDKNVQLNPKLRSQNQLSTSHLDKSSLQPRSQLNRKRALDNAGVDQSPPQKMQRLAIKVKNQAA